MKINIFILALIILLLPKLKLNAQKRCPEQIKILSFNLTNPNKETIKEVKQIIQKESPDFVDIQEHSHLSHKTEIIPSILNLAKQTGLKAYYIEPISHGENYYCIAILSKYPIIQFKSQKLPNIKDSEMNSAVELLALTNTNDTIRLVNTHFDHCFENNILKTSQVKYLAQLYGNKIPTISIGNFNLKSQSDIFKLNEWFNSVDNIHLTYPQNNLSNKTDYFLTYSKNQWNIKDHSNTNYKNINYLSVVASLEHGNYAKFKWTSKEIEPGIIWKSFIGYTEIFKSNQSINIIEIDLNKTDKKLTFTHNYIKNKWLPLNSLAKRCNAIVAINGGYSDNENTVDEKRFYTHFRSEGINYQTIQIPYTHRCYWKNEGCLYITKKGQVGIEFGNKAYFESIKAPYVLSSSPILIKNGIPIGKYFLPNNISDKPLTTDSLNLLDYENPYRHQGIRHPRSAIGIKKQNIIIMVAIDGRADQAQGMTAAELTTLLFDYLGCKEALNLDGGGSTSMYIEKEKPNGIVNYPARNYNSPQKKFNHYGLRKIPNAIVLVPND